MVRTFCDRCGRVITGMSAHERVSVTASGARDGVRRDAGEVKEGMKREATDK